MDLKKEDQEYIDSEINKQNTTQNNQDYYKNQNKSFLILSFVGIIMATILRILFTPIGGQINIIILLIITIFFSFSSVYIIWSFLFWIISFISKKTKENYKFKFIIKLGTAVVFTLVIIFLGSVSICAGGSCGNRNLNPAPATKQLLRDQINNSSAEICTDVVTFQKNSSLVAEGITKDTGLNYSQVYFDNPEHLSNFDVSNRSVLKYTSTSNKNVVICIICSNNGKLELEEALIQNGINTIIDSNIEGETLCLVYPKKI